MIYLCRGCNIGVNIRMCKEKPAVAIKTYNKKSVMTLDLQSSTTKKIGTKIMLILKISTLEHFMSLEF